MFPTVSAHIRLYMGLMTPETQNNPLCLGTSNRRLVGKIGVLVSALGVEEPFNGLSMAGYVLEKSCWWRDWLGLPEGRSGHDRAGEV